MTRDDIEAFFATLKAANPQPVSELEYSSVFELLVAVLLSAQATDASVNKATRRLFAVAGTPRKMLALGEAGLIEAHQDHRPVPQQGAAPDGQTAASSSNDMAVRCRARARRCRRCPGVGRKTANVVLNVAFGEPTIAVDTHVFRVANRTGLAPGKDPLKVELALLERVPAAYLADAHHWLILHGRYVCQARKPMCPQCQVAAWCDFTPKTQFR